MRYIVGVDGGGTKTDILLCREDGSCCGRTVVGGSNHQLIGLEQAGKTLLSGIEALLESQGVKRKELAAVCLGLSGADFEEDIRALEGIIAPLGQQVPCKVINDAWLPLAAMAPTGAGAVSICGTGHNTAVRMADGKRLQISALGYVLGNWGGGNMLTTQAMHAAMRAAEHTGEATRLTEELPRAYGQADMLALQREFYLNHCQGMYAAPVPQMVSRLAAEKDAVCIRLLEHDGRVQAEMTAGLIAHAGLQARSLPVVLAGGLYLKDTSGYLVKGYREELLRRCPKARLMLLDKPPVVGAALLALQEAGLLRAGSSERIAGSIVMEEKIAI